MTNSYYYEFFEPLTDGMEMGFLFHEYKHAKTRWELRREDWVLKKILEIEKFMQTAKPFPKSGYGDSVDPKFCSAQHGYGDGALQLIRAYDY